MNNEPNTVDEIEVIREITIQANAAEQAASIRTAAEALVEYVEKIPSKLPLMEYRDVKFIAGIIERCADLKAALSCGWLARKEATLMCECGVPLYLHGSLTACCLPTVNGDAGSRPSQNFQLASTQKALKGLYNAVQKSRDVNDPLGMATAMEEAGKWF